MRYAAGKFVIGLVRPHRENVFTRSIKATDRAWREAIFGMGGSKKRIGGAKIGSVDGQPLAVIAELPEATAARLPYWTIKTDAGLWAFAGPAAVYNDAGYGPATVGLTVDRLRELVDFNPEPQAMAEGLRRTLDARSQPNATKPV